MIDREVTESFHLAFLTALGEVADREQYILKGGANLRFFHGSVRFSEDVDLDVPEVEAQLFTEKVERAFNGALLKRLLALIGVEMVHLNPKDRTATKERWGVGLRHGTLDQVATRVEISYREYAYPPNASVVARVNEDVTKRLSAVLNPPLVRHYLPKAAVAQKVVALADRRNTQPRDVFDLDLLFRRYPGAVARGDIAGSELEIAIARTFEISYGEYASRVVTFIEPELVPIYAPMDAWGGMQSRVVERLEGLLP
jgi:hypothetical protein